MGRVTPLIPVARRLDCVAELESIPKLISRGASYQRQRAVVADGGGNLIGVVDSLMAEMRDGLAL
jgi:carboxylate-amine ligase